MELPLIPVEQMPENKDVPVINALNTLSVSVLLDMLESSVRQITMKMFPGPTTMGLCARIESMTTPALVCLDNKA